ncbi:unnamed protein product [Diamesa hyperborea]
MSNQNRRSPRNNKRKLEVDVIHPLSSQFMSSTLEELPEQIKIDPLTRLPNLFQYNYILKYLSYEDIMNLTLVSKSWLNVVENCSSSMSRMRVRIDFSKSSSKSPTLNELKLLKNSKRKYQNIDFSCQHNQKLSEECLKFIKSFRGTIVELHIQEMTNVNTDSIGDISMPNLKVLKIKATSASPCKGLFNSCRNLEVVHFDTNYDVSILTCLYRNPKIYDIKFSNDVFESIFNIDPLSDFPFEISSFTSLAWKTDEMTEFNFIQFLAKQAYNLTDLKLFYASHKMVEFIYNELDTINIIDIKYFEVCRDIIEPFDPIPDHDEITEINFHHNILLVGIRAMIKAAPKLRVLRMKFINKSIVEFVTVFCKNLRLLVYCYDMDKGEEFYKIITKNTRTEINKKIIFKCTKVQ